MNLKNHRKQFITKLRRLCEDYNMILDGRIMHVYARKNCNKWDAAVLPDFDSHPRKSIASIGFGLLKK